MTNLLSVPFLLFFSPPLSRRLGSPAQPMTLLCYEVKCCRMLELNHRSVSQSDFRCGMNLWVTPKFRVKPHLQHEDFGGRSCWFVVHCFKEVLKLSHIFENRRCSSQPCRLKWNPHQHHVSSAKDLMADGVRHQPPPHLMIHTSLTEESSWMSYIIHPSCSGASGFLG